MIKLNSDQLQSLARIARDIDRIQERLQDSDDAWLDADGSFTLAVQTFSVDPVTARKTLANRQHELIARMAGMGVEWEAGPRTSRTPGTEWQSGAKPPSWYDQAQGG